MGCELMTDEIRQDIKDYLDGKIRTHVSIFKKYPELDAILDEHFKKEGIFELDHRDDNLTSLGMSGNSAERLYAYVNGVKRCEVCGKKLLFRNKKVAYETQYCGDCGPLMGSKHNAEKRKKKANHHYVTKKCLCCGNEFTYLCCPNNKHEYKNNQKFCSPSCRFKYIHANMSDGKRIEVANKKKQTCLERYGDEYVVNSQYTRDKIKEKLGVERPQYLENYGEICRESYIKKHGHEFKHTEETIERIKATKIEKYGSVMAATSRYREYTFPSGKVVKIQGYEDVALTKLLETYDENDLIVGRKNIEKFCGSFLYLDPDDQREHIYYPDIFVKPEDKFIEVKSPFTYKAHERINALKRQCVIDRGFCFEFWIIQVNRYKDGRRTLKNLEIK